MESTANMSHHTDTPDRIALHHRAGRSDKVYQAAMKPAGNGLFTVAFAYGRRGSTLQTGTKTNGPVPYQEARAIYERLVGEKTAKGYTPADDGTPYRNTANEKRDTPGRPASAGAPLKFKFHETASCLAIGRNDRHSVALGLFRGGSVVPCGNVTVPAGREIPIEGTPVDVRYLQAFPQSGTLFQPVYQGPHDAIAATACTIEQLKYKAA
jgi:predicted DNA-binding WGR domain protein